MPGKVGAKPRPNHEEFTKANKQLPVIPRVDALQEGTEAPKGVLHAEHLRMATYLREVSQYETVGSVVLPVEVP